MEHLAEQLARIPGVLAVTLGGSRATGTAGDDSDWDFGLYYRGTLDTAAIAGLGWPGRVFSPGEWGAVVNGGAWLTVDGTKVDLIYRDLDEVLLWTRAAERGGFEIRREVGYVAGIPTYVLAAELALGKVLTGDLPHPAFPEPLRVSAPELWFRIAAGALHFAAAHARRSDRVACLANVTHAALATAEGRLAAMGEWVLNEKGIVARAGLGGLAERMGDDHLDLVRLVADCRDALELDDTVWTEASGR